MRPILLPAIAMLASFVTAAAAEETFSVQPRRIADEKAVFATIESLNVIPARARIGGTVAELKLQEGDRVESGAVVATVGDAKLALHLRSLDAQIEGLMATLAQANIDLHRYETLVPTGAAAKSQLDNARTAVKVATNDIAARTAERSVIEQQMSEGAVLAPTAGRVLKVPVTAGTVILPGETIAMIAEENFVLRLQIPERHARLLKVGDRIRLGNDDVGSDQRFGSVILVYPGIENGRVIADAAVEGLGDYFIGERVRAFISAGERSALIVPATFVATRFGVDYVRVKGETGAIIEVPVQLGRPTPSVDFPGADMPDGVEILSGLNPGDILVLP